MNKKIIAGIIIGLVLGSVSVYAGTKFYASDVSVNAPTGSGLGSNATLQNALDDLYSKLSYKDGTAIYYNPNTGKKCTSSEAVSKTGTKSGCMKWYIFGDGIGHETVNMILDHNTTARVYWSKTTDEVTMTEARTVLENDTKGWVNIARFISPFEVATITGNTNFSGLYSQRFYLDSNSQNKTANSKGASKYAWLYDYTYNCTSSGCNTEDNNVYKTYSDNSISGYNYGYWTNARVEDVRGLSWAVGYAGYLWGDGVDSTATTGHSDRGIRPVITVSKSIIK